MQESFIKPIDKTFITFYVSPEHVIVVSIYLEQLFICIDVCFRWKNPFKMSFSTQLFF
jgi:hypothetical protein